MKTALHWLPRILGIAAILFVSMFALDSFGPGMPLSKQIGNFLIHLIPSYVLLLILLIAWKWELVGGSLFVLVGLGLAPFIFRHNYQMNHSVGMTLFVLLIINVPFVLVGGLFILNHFRGREHLAQRGGVGWKRVIGVRYVSHGYQVYRAELLVRRHRSICGPELEG
jgi:hypothetical protein